MAHDNPTGPRRKFMSIAAIDTVDSLLSVVLRVAAFEPAVLPPPSAFRTDAKIRELSVCHDLILRTALEMCF